MIKTFLNQPSIHQPPIKSLRQLADTSDEVIRGLKALGPEAEKRDIWLIHLIINKLDTETRQLWARETVDEDFPAFDTFLEFLNKRCNAIEDWTSTNEKKSQLSVKVLHVAASPSSNCPKCALGHELYSCLEFLKLPVDERKSLVKQKGLCFNCLRAGHPVKTCNSKGHCRTCGRGHHTLIHESISQNPSSSFCQISHNHSDENSITSASSKDLIIPSSYNPVIWTFNRISIVTNCCVPLSTFCYITPLQNTPTFFRSKIRSV